jgi:hypothetical protein
MIAERETSMAGPGRFAAFISYSSHDAAFARRLHSALEGYRVPSGAGSFNLAGKPNRVAPVFLDRAELSSGELDAAITSAIENSTALIVVCSPHAAKSEWVDKEIRRFVETGRVRRIFAIIASGEPFASAHGAADNECFPSALREMAAGKLGERYEVVAGDARPGKDGFRNAWLKVAAGVLDVGFGKLLDRDAAARRGRTLLLGTTAAVVAAVVGTLTTFWFLESQRFQSEARASLLREARSAFELDDAARAVTALASLVPGMPAEERAVYQPVLDAWSARFPHLAASIANAPTAFSYGERVFLKTPSGILATPLSPDVIVAAGTGEETVYAIDFNGRVWRWRAGETRATDLQLPVDVLGGHDWASAVKLKSGGVVFGGSKQATYAGGEDPVVLIVNEAARTFALVGLGYAPLEELRLESDCSAIAFEAGSIDYDFGSEGEEAVIEEIKHVEGFKRLDLRSATAKQEQITAEAFESIPQIRFEADDDPFDRGRRIVNAIAATCGGGKIAEGPPPPLAATLAVATRELDTPDGALTASGAWDWALQERWNEEPRDDGPEVARIAALTDAIQRARVEIGKVTRIRDGAVDTLPPQEETFVDEEPDPQADAELVSYEYGAQLGIYLAVDAAAEPTLSFYAAEGKYIGANVCGFVTGKPKCINMGGLVVEFASFPDFIYAGGTNYLGYPLFTLIDRRTFDAIEFRSDELDISPPEPAYAGAVALSPTGRQMAIAFARTVLLFDLDEKLVPRLAKRLSVSGLAEGADGGLRGVCTALTYLDETTLVAARGDGLTLKLDLRSGEELWRFRLPASVGCDSERRYVPVQAIPSPDGKRLAVRGSNFVAMLDTGTGLPLLPAAKIGAAMRWEDDGYYTEERAMQIAGDYAVDTEDNSFESRALTVFAEGKNCIETGVGCKSGVELTRSARNLSKLSEPLLVVTPSGETLARSPSFDITLAPPPDGSPAVSISASPQCFTGWRVAGSRIEPFDLMKDVKIGAPPIPEADLLAQCR